MAKRFTLKDHFREIRLFHSRLAAGLVVAILLVCALVARLMYLQILSHERFATLSHDNRVNIQPVSPTRGLIFDRKGKLLAQNLPAFSLEVVPEQTKNLTETLEQLGQIITISPDEIARFDKLRRQTPAFESIPLRVRLSDEEVARFAVTRHRFPGVDIVARLVRNYPMEKLGVHAVGYVGRISEEELRQVDPSAYRGTSHIGKTGIERAYENVLRGRDGVQHLEVNALGRPLRVLKEDPSTPGENLMLTIDSDLQRVAEAALGDRRGSVVAIEPRSGDVLALASTPTYDPNPFVVGIDSAAYSLLNESLDRPLFNRALRGQYPPGSTVKPFVALAGLEYDKIAGDTRTFCPGWYSLRNDKHKYRDWKRGGHGNVDLRHAIAESCDVYFYDLSLTLGIDLIDTFLGQFGFGSQVNIDIGGEQSGILPSRDWKRRVYKQGWYPGETVIVGIGQGYFTATPLQLAAATAALANHGVRMRPRTVRATQNPDTLAVQQIPPLSESTIHFANPDNWDQVVAAMTEVVHGKRGTAKAIGKDAPYLIAGKTGTAQVKSIKQDERYDPKKLSERELDHAWFIAFAPVGDPKIAVAVLVENGGSGSAAAAPIARVVMDYYLLVEPTLKQANPQQPETTPWN